MRVISTVVALGAFFLVLSAALICPANAQTGAPEIAGQITTRVQTGLADAEIGILGTDLTTTSDAAGRFRLRGLTPGRMVVRVRRIGYSAQYFSATLRDGEKKEVTIVLDPRAQELPELTVTARSAKPIEYAWTTRFDDFFARRFKGVGGSFITREDIERQSPFRTANLLSSLPGIHLRFRHSGPSGTDIEFPRCERVSVWVDGRKERSPNIPQQRNSFLFRVDTTGMALSELLERTPPSQIEMMEVYKGAGEMPAEFLDDSCAAIVIWTR